MGANVATGLRGVLDDDLVVEQVELQGHVLRLVPHVVLREPEPPDRASVPELLLVIPFESLLWVDLSLESLL